MARMNPQIVPVVVRDYAAVHPSNAEATSMLHRPTQKKNSRGQAAYPFHSLCRRAILSRSSLPDQMDVRPSSYRVNISAGS